MKRVISSQFQHVHKAIEGLSAQQRVALHTFNFWINEANRKGILIDDVVEYVKSRTFNNPRSAFNSAAYRNSTMYAQYLEDIADVASRLSNTRELAFVARNATETERKTQGMR